MNKTEEIIKKLDTQLAMSLMKYVNAEQLSRLEKINEYYNSNPSTEKLVSSIETSESLSKDLVLPLKVRGIFLTEGRPKKKFYTAEELRKATLNPINQSFKLMVDHRDKEADKIIGMVDSIWYDDTIKGIRWKGHINSEVAALNIIDKAITEVSVTVFSVESFDNELGIVGTDLTFKELSLVLGGSEPFNKIELDE